MTPSEYRKLLNIQKVAKADIVKQIIPNAQDVIKNKKDKIKKSVHKIIESSNLDNLKEISEEILQGNDAITAIAALLKHAFKDELAASNYHDISSNNRVDRLKGDKSRVDKKGTTRLFIAKGKKDKFNSPIDLAKFLEKRKWRKLKKY